MNCFVKDLDTPLGRMVLAASGDSVLALTWTRADLARLGIPAASEGGGLIDEAEGQLEEYFRGKRTRFDLAFSLRGTPFQQRVWAELARIPYGKTWSYQELAKRVGSPAAVRAVGSANARNPVCIFIPCHRVVRASGELGGYAGGVENKARLLELEGIAIPSRVELLEAGGIPGPPAVTVPEPASVLPEDGYLPCERGKRENTP